MVIEPNHGEVRGEQRMSVKEVDPEADEAMYARERYLHGGCLGEAILIIGHDACLAAERMCLVS